MEIKQQIKDRQDASEKYLQTKWGKWDTLEALFHNQLSDSISAGQKSQVFDPKLSTMLIERAYRVMSQNPIGKVVAISKNDQGAEKMMNLIVEKYVLPNANSQFDFLTKMRMVDLYSNLYGGFFVLVDWVIKNNGYIGPDMFLMNARDVFPQVGAMSIEDSEYIITRTWRPISFFESLKKDKGFDNIGTVIAKLKEKASSPKIDKSKRNEEEYPDESGVKGKGYYECWTMYERDRWVDYSVDADTIFRDIKNPHENDELPVVCKHSMPLIDDFMGMGDMERGETMQQLVNSTWNLYLDTVKMSLMPPLMVNKDYIASDSSIKWGAAEKWLVRGPQGSTAIQPINLNPQGLTTFNNVYQVANASLLNMFGTTDTTTTRQTDVGFGKTPQALEMQAVRENTRDSADRFYMEQFAKQVIKKMVNLVSKKHSNSVTIRMFEDEINELVKAYPDIQEMYDPNTGKLTIDRKRFGSLLYDYEIVSGSTYATDQQTQQNNLSQLLTMLISQPQVMQSLSQEGYNFKIGEMFKRMLVNSGLNDWNKILEIQKPEEVDENVFNQDKLQFLSAVQQMQGIGQIPEQPDQSQQLPVQSPDAI
jgi:hypothetical protein